MLANMEVGHKLFSNSVVSVRNIQNTAKDCVQVCQHLVSIARFYKINYGKI